MGTRMKETAYVINVILLLHVVHAFGVHMGWCMERMHVGHLPYCCHSLAISETTSELP